MRNSALLVFSSLAVLCVPVCMAANAVAASDTAAVVATQDLEANNNWSVTINNELKLDAPLYVTIKQLGNHWAIDHIYSTPPQLKRSVPVELFMATRDLQQWANAYRDMRTDCDKFEVRESEYQSVCTSRLAAQKPGLGILGLFLNSRSSGRTPFAYTDAMVSAAIHSIRPQEAAASLSAFEQGQ